MNWTIVIIQKWRNHNMIVGKNLSYERTWETLKDG